MKTFADVKDLTYILCKQGKHEQAEAFFRDVLSGPPETWDNDDRDIFLSSFAMTLDRQGKRDEAANIRRQRINSHSEDGVSDVLERSAT